MRIQALKLYTSNLAEQIAFYENILGFTIIDQSNNHVIFEVGKSSLKFEYRAQTTPYHFAINIPANKIEEALKWMKSKVNILKYDTHEIQNFDSWNAKAIYFYDADNNIVELIARKNLKNETDETFDEKQFLEISEIGLPTTNIEKIFKQLNEIAHIEIYDGGLERFCAIGDETGLFICINLLQKNWFPTNDKAFASDFELTFNSNSINYAIEFKDHNLNQVPLI